MRLSGSKSRVRIDLVGPQDAVAEVQERRELVPREAHEPEEHRRRQQLRELLGEVALAAVGERVDEVVDACGDVGFLRLHLLRGEDRIEDLPVLRVLGRIDVQRDQRPDVAEIQTAHRREQLVVPEHVVGELPAERDGEAFVGLEVAAVVDRLAVERLRGGEIEDRLQAGGRGIGIVHGLIVADPSPTRRLPSPRPWGCTAGRGSRPSTWDTAPVPTKEVEMTNQSYVYGWLLQRLEWEDTLAGLQVRARLEREADAGIRDDTERGVRRTGVPCRLRMSGAGPPAVPHSGDVPPAGPPARSEHDRATASVLVVG